MRGGEIGSEGAAIDGVAGKYGLALQLEVAAGDVERLLRVEGLREIELTTVAVVDQGKVLGLNVHNHVALIAEFAERLANFAE